MCVVGWRVGLVALEIGKKKKKKRKSELEIAGNIGQVFGGMSKLKT